MFKIKSKWLKSLMVYTLSATLLLNYHATSLVNGKAADYHEPIAMVNYVETIEEEIVMEIPTIMVREMVIEEPVVEEELIEPMIIEEPMVVEEEETIELPFTDEEIDLIALVTMAEAEGESEEGKRLVIDTILNRVDHEDFPDSVTEVVYQPNQFTSMWNGRIDRCYVDEYIRELVVGEIEKRTNTEVMFFTAGKYGKYGEPMFTVGNHYFSSYT